MKSKNERQKKYSINKRSYEVLGTMKGIYGRV